MYALLYLLIAAQLPGQTFTSPGSPKPEYGHGLSAEEASAGWIALFDGATTFGWTGAAVEKDVLVAGTTTSSFGRCRIKGEATAGGQLSVGNQNGTINPGKFDLE